MRSFIKTRLNKDNFWNLMFLTLPSLPVFIAQEAMDLISGGIFLLLATLVLSPYLVSRANKVEYKDDMFHSTSTKRALCPYMPEAVGFVLWLAIPFTTLWVLYIKYPILNKNLAVYNLVFWFVPTMYFILKNLPIAIIFNKTAWTKGNGTSVFDSSSSNWRYSQHHLSNTHSNIQESILTSPRYISHSCNIYHHK